MSFRGEDFEEIGCGGGSAAVIYAPVAPRRQVEVDVERTADAELFVALVERHRHGLRAHCYRLLGSHEDAEDQVQETALRAWRKLHEFEGRSTMRAWLYTIATNACLDQLRRRAARPTPADEVARTGGLVVSDSARTGEGLCTSLAKLAAGLPDPEAEAIDRETIELVFLVAIQQLRPEQRAVLIFRDVLGWSAKETADMFGVNGPGVHSTLLRARTAISKHLAPDRIQWGRLRRPSLAERDLLERSLAAFDDGEVGLLADLLRAE